MLIHTGVETWTVVIKFGLCKNCDLRISKCFCHFDVIQKSNQELPEGGVDKRRNASELQLKSD